MVVMDALFIVILFRPLAWDDVENFDVQDAFGRLLYMSAWVFGMTVKNLSDALDILVARRYKLGSATISADAWALSGLTAGVATSGRRRSWIDLPPLRGQRLPVEFLGERMAARLGSHHP